jgi:hypothetical protein
MKVEDKPLTMPLTMPPAEKTEEVWQPENDFRTGFLTVFQPSRPVERSRQETARFSGEPSRRPIAPGRASFVSLIVRRAARSRVRLNDLALSLT